MFKHYFEKILINLKEILINFFKNFRWKFRKKFKSFGKILINLETTLSNEFSKKKFTDLEKNSI